MAYDVTLITGDGIGPEIAEAAKECIDATGISIRWKVMEAGLKVYGERGDPLPKDIVDSIMKTKVAIKAPITTPVGKGFRSVNVRLRKELDLYA
ncbi:MAG: isocitrate/isopropylmalate family dehydrogenase, partial [Candidatus Methanofastidiosia archaeon]